MSDDTAPALPPSEPLPPPPEATTHFKPLPTPVQSGIQPSSTIVEPPRTPNPINPATDNQGNNALEDAVTERATGTGMAIDSGPPSATITTPQEDPSLPPLPQDAPVPPSPKAADEPPPVLPPDAIPPAVSTPTVILTEEQAMEPAGAVEPTQANGEAATAPLPLPEEPVENPPASAPALSAPPPPVDSVDQTLPIPAPSANHEESSAPPVQPIPETAQSSSNAMEVDPVVTGDISQNDLTSSASTQSLKRPGEELDGREEKRARDDVGGIDQTAIAAPAPAPAPTPAPAEQSLPAVAPPTDLPLNVVPNYEPPPPEPAGPATPLTLTQHKHLLGGIRALKKIKEYAFFAEPVNPVLQGIPHYPQIISKPMDLGTVETKLIVSDPRGPPKDKSRMKNWDESKGSYRSVQDVVLDVRQIWWNTARFNGRDHFVTQGGDKLGAIFDRTLVNLPAEPAAIPPPMPSPAAAGPSSQRRASISQPPIIRRTSDGTDRPKREIHPPPSKDLSYAEVPGTRKPKRRNDPQLQWAARVFSTMEKGSKTFELLSPFLYPVEQIIAGVPEYGRIIKKPIDLNIIKAKLDEGEYEGLAQLDADMQLMLKNALTFNHPTEPVYLTATQLQQLWAEKMSQAPAKQEPREESEDPLAVGSVDGDVYSEEEDDNGELAELEAQLAEIQGKIDAIKARKAKGRSSKSAKSRSKKAPSSAPRKQSKASPGVNGSAAKKVKKAKDVGVYPEDEEADEEDFVVSTAQKEELADKIQKTDGGTLQKAIEIIQQTTQLGADGGEIELDIESLPVPTVVKLYNLVCKPAKRLSGPRKAAAMGKKPGRKPGAPRKSMDEQAEAERIRKMEAQLQSFSGGGAPMGVSGGGAYEGEDSESSEEEDSDEE